MDATVRQRLIDAALSVRQKAHAPYSGFHVGAALLTGTGEGFAGCNVENASFGLTICAERAAVCAAVAGAQAGSRPTIAAIAIATEGGHAPCGACRQVLAEFKPQQRQTAMVVLLVDATDPSRVRETTLDALLPDPFDYSGLQQHLAPGQRPGVH